MIRKGLVALPAEVDNTVQDSLPGPEQVHPGKGKAKASPDTDRA